MRNENSTEIQYSYTKSLVLKAYLIPHSSFRIPHSTLLEKVCTRMCKLYFVLRPIYIIFAT